MASKHDRFVVGLFDDRAEADKVVRDLKTAKFDDRHIDIIDRSGRAGLTDHLERHGVPQSHSHFYAEGVRRGGTLVQVFTDDAHYASAVELMRNHGAVDINRRASYYKQQGFTRHDETTPDYDEKKIAEERRAYASHQYDDKTGEAVLPEIEEQVHVGKETVQRGGVRIFARKSEVPVEKHVTLRDEKVSVNREQVDRPASQGDLDSFKEGEVTVTETSERPRVSKEARVTGEVHVGKEVTEHDETVRDTARKTKVDVEQVEGGRGARR